MQDKNVDKQFWCQIWRLLDGRSKKTYGVQVDKHVLLLDVNIIAANTTNKAHTSKENVEKNTRKTPYEWFKDFHLPELLRSVETNVITKVYSSKPVTRVTRQYLATAKDVTTQNLKIQYHFKKRFVAVQQFALLKKDKMHNLNGKTENNEDNYHCYDSLSIFPEKLVVFVKQKVIEKEQQPINMQVQESAIDNERTNEISSNYFAETTDCSKVTSAIKRKKTSLKKMAKKSKIALLESQPVNASSETSTQEQSDGDKDCLNIQTPCTTVNSIQTNSEVIDLDEIPKGLDNIRRVEDLCSNHLKFLVNNMEEHLRTIFRGEVYSRRHEDYKKGGKSRDDLNFQVGMAHFTEDQHDCIMDALMAMFCYKHTKYIDYVTKVIFPEALMKLYKDVHQTTIEEAEVRLLNDTCL